MPGMISNPLNGNAYSVMEKRIFSMESGTREKCPWHFRVPPPLILTWEGHVGIMGSYNIVVISLMEEIVTGLIVY